MPTDFTPLHLGFEKLAEQITAPGRIDVEQAVAAGRRAAARRRAARAGVATVGVAATAALALTVVDMAAAPGPSRPIVSSSPPATTPGAGTDPIGGAASFGWLPSGMHASGYSMNGNTSPDAEENILAEANSSTPTNVLELGTAPAGPRPTLQLNITPAETPVFTDGPSINGHQSFLETFPSEDAGFDADSYYLMWQFDDGTWATLLVDVGQQPLSEAEVLHVARTVTDKVSPIPQRFQIDGPLAQAEVVHANILFTGVKLVMQAGGAEIDITIQQTTIAGQSCKTGPAPEGGAACVTVHGQLPPSLAKGGVQGILDDITLLQMPTLDVIRR